MKRTQLVPFITAALFGAVQAETTFEFTPSLLIETGVNQSLKKDAETGSLFVEKMEAGMEMAWGEKLTGAVIVEHDEGNIALSEVLVTYGFNDIFSLSAGQLVNNFGDYGSEALTDPLIIDYGETKEPAVMLDITGSTFYGAVALYNGVLSGKLNGIVPSIGFNANDLVDLKLSGRMESAGGDLFTDLSAVAAITPELFTLKGELYLETKEKEKDAGKVFGYYAEADIYAGEKWTIFGRWDHVIDDIDANEKSGLMQIQAGAGFTPLEPLRLGAALGFDNNFSGSESDWTPSIAAEVKFEL